MHKFLQLAIKEANNHEFDPLLTFRLCAVIVGGGKVLSVGFNKTARNGFVNYMSQFETGAVKPFANTHAEMDAVLKVRNKIDLTGCKIFVARRKREGDPIGMAKPCEICQMVLTRYGIRRAYYTIDSNNYGVMSIQSSGISSNVLHSLSLAS